MAAGGRMGTSGGAAAELRCWAPHVCALLQLPAPPQAPSAPVCHGFGFVAVDLFAAPATPEVCPCPPLTPPHYHTRGPSIRVEMLSI